MRLLKICILIVSVVLVSEGYVIRRKLRTDLLPPSLKVGDKSSDGGKMILRSGLRVRSLPREENEESGAFGSEPKMRLERVPVLETPRGRWFFDWLWGYDNGGYYAPPPPPVQYEHCVDYFDPLTHDLITECTPLRADLPSNDNQEQ